MTVLAQPSPLLRSALSVAAEDAPPLPTAAEWPRVDVIVAFRNEAGLLGAKVRNLRGLDYPRDRIRFLMIDGGSSDRSESIGRAAAAGDPRFRWLSAGQGGKTRQLNLALARTNAPWLLITDADARLPRDSARRLVECGESDPNIGLVGTECHPRRATALDRTHWTIWNAVRRVENRLGCVTVLGPCFLLRRARFTGWPDDVVADDVFSSLETNRLGMQSRLARVLVIEHRAPDGARSFLWHKIRKVRAVLFEIFRFLPRAGEFHTVPRLAFIVKALSILAGPVFVLACAVACALTFPGGALAFALLVTLAFLVPARLQFIRAATGPLRAAGLVLTISIVLVTAILTLPFARPRAVFCRWNLEES
jgi:cellulose synthase/poly-beta-1,6-N-acetylglucosamine synthase-like glycosyltransferase